MCSGLQFSGMDNSLLHEPFCKDFDAWVLEGWARAGTGARHCCCKHHHPAAARCGQALNRPCNRLVASASCGRVGVGAGAEWPCMGLLWACCCAHPAFTTHQFRHTYSAATIRSCGSMQHSARSLTGPAPAGPSAGPGRPAQPRTRLELRWRAGVSAQPAG